MDIDSKLCCECIIDASHDKINIDFLIERQYIYGFLYEIMTYLHGYEYWLTKLQVDKLCNDQMIVVLM
jgi:hypothetical protein